MSPEGVDKGALRLIQKEWQQHRRSMGKGDRARLLVIGRVERDADRTLHLGAGFTVGLGEIATSALGNGELDAKRVLKSAANADAVWMLDLEAVGAPE